MGASYHAAMICALHLNHLGISAIAMEALDLINYAQRLISPETVIVYISQSGSSGEVTPLLEQLDGRVPLVGITNHPESELGCRAQVVLPMVSGDESLVATKTYINTLAVLWLAAGRISGSSSGAEFTLLSKIADQIESLLAEAEWINARFHEAIDPQKPLLFLGHGPHAITARQAAMVMSEWSKVPALHFGIGAFRHGFIETVQEGVGAVVYAPPGRTAASAIALADELSGYGAQVLLVENGHLRETGKLPLTMGVDEFLSPILDIIPIQLFTENLARRLGFGNGFRYIAKVVKQL
jgi:glucosamine--fructose-6-phosphate aminotransferase (isomerizing)